MIDDPAPPITVDALDRVEARTVGMFQRGLDRLEQHIKELMHQHDRRYEQRFAAAQEAVLKAEVASEKRFEGVNEFRAQLADQQRTFIPRIEAEQRLDALETMIRALDNRVQSNAAAVRGGKEVWALVVAAIMTILAIASFAIRVRP